MYRKFRRALVGAIVTVAMTSGAMSAQAAHEPPAERLLVRTAGTPPTARALIRATGLPVLSVRRVGPRVAVVRVGTDADRAAKRLVRAGGVLSASVDRRFTLAGAASPVQPGDIRYSSQWDLWDSASTARAGGYGVDAPRAWTRTTGSADVVVAVLDTGITQHPDLDGASLADGYDFVSPSADDAADGSDVDSADGDGWDDDPSDPGDACAAEGEPSSWHGTFVAGEIAAQHRSSAAVAGLAPGITLEPVRVLGACGGSESDAIAAIEWASGGDVPGVPANTRPADVISMSLGGDRGACSAALQTAIDDATGRGAVVVAAAGNDGRPVADVSPANCAGVVSVAATTRSGALAGYSNHGTRALSPTIAAPGGSSADPVLGDGWSSEAGAGEDGDTAVLVRSIGTSMAAPRVAAAAALLLSVQPQLTPAQVRQRLTATATRFPASSGCTTTVCGAGIVNAGNLVGAPSRLLRVRSASVIGTARVGRVLTARAGAWRPAAISVRYQWLRDGRPITGATHRNYRPTTADAGHRIAVRCRVERPGAVAAASLSAARRVQR